MVGLLPCTPCSSGTSQALGIFPLTQHPPGEGPLLSVELGTRTPGRPQSAALWAGCSFTDKPPLTPMEKIGVGGLPAEVR